MENKEQPKRFSLAGLEEVKELNKNQIIGFLTLKLNDTISQLIEHELVYRLMCEQYEKDKNQKEKSDAALNGMNKSSDWVEGDRLNIKLIRGLIDDFTNDKIVI